VEQYCPLLVVVVSSLKERFPKRYGAFFITIACASSCLLSSCWPFLLQTSYIRRHTSLTHHCAVQRSHISLHTARKMGNWCIKLLKLAYMNVNTVHMAETEFVQVSIWSELLYTPTQPEPSETSFLSFL